MKVMCSFDRMVKLSDLKPHKHNSNSHPEIQIKALAEIIKSVGWRSPVVVSTLSGCIVKGHCRVEVAKLLGLDEVPVDFQSYDSEVQELQDLTADNTIQSYSEFSLVDFDLALKDLDLSFNEIDKTLFGLLEDEIDFIETPPEDMTNDPIEPNYDVVVKCRDAQERQDILLELQSRGLDFKVRG